MLFVLIVTELVITANLHALISVHIFVGVLLSGLLVVKLVRKVPRLIASDWSNQRQKQVSGRAGRLGINIFGLIVGAIAAVVMMPVSAMWRHLRIGAGLPSPLVLGIVAAVFAVLLAIPILRKANVE